MTSGFSEIGAAARLLRSILDPAATPRAEIPPAAAPATAEPTSHAGRIERELELACRQLGATGGLVADGDGLPLASARSGLSGDAAPVTAAVLGEALARAAQVLGATGVQQAALQLGGPERLVLRRFQASGRSYNLLLAFPPGAAEPRTLSTLADALAQAIEAGAPTGETGP